MIDIKAIKSQLREYLSRKALDAAPLAERLTRAVASFCDASADSQSWRAVLEEVISAWKSRKPSLLIPTLPSLPGDRFHPSECPASYACLATDGSHILPSRHEIPELALIQTGRIAIAYRSETPPQLDAATRLVIPELLESILVDPTERPTLEQYVVDERAMTELEELTALGETYSNQPARLGLLDGSLIHWNLADRSTAWQAYQLDRTRDALKRMEQARTPLVGYISRPGSREVIHALGIYDYFKRVGRAPSKPAEIFVRSDTGEVSDWVSSLTDRLLFARLLEPGQRSAWFGSGSHIVREYGEENRILFCYLKTESDLVRLEIPAWAEGYSDTLHALVLDQCRKGRGYPITLSEAHEQAVVRGSDRELFYKMAIEEWHRARRDQGLRSPLPIPSPKQQRKTRPLF